MKKGQRRPSPIGPSPPGERQRHEAGPKERGKNRRMINTNRLQNKAEAQGLILSEKMLQKCLLYSQLLDEWNARINMTAITDPEEVEDKHFLDCLILAKQPEVEGRVADIGSGAGFPGLLLKMYKPDIELSLIESNQKRAAFLREAAKTLQLELEVLPVRAEEAVAAGKREFFDLVTARAVAALPALCEYCLPLVAVGGHFVPMKGKVEEEWTAAGRAISLLGGKKRELRRYKLPDGSERSLCVIQKVAHTAEKYPRSTARIKKSPL